MNELVGFISLIVLVLIQLGMFAYGYGKLSETVKTNYARIDKLEVTVNSLRYKVEKLEINITNLYRNDKSNRRELK